MAEATWVNAKSADGPKVAAWFMREFPELLAENEGRGALARRVRDWRKGAHAEFYTIDRYVTKLGLHVSCVPEDVWRLEFTRGGDQRSAESPTARRPFVYEPKTCELCGENIPLLTTGGKKRPPYKWKKIRFCSPLCQRRVALVRLRETMNGR